MPLRGLKQLQADRERLGKAKYILQHRIPEGPGYSLLAGPPGVGKTNLLLNLGLSIANGKPWMDIPTTRSKVGYIMFEGGDNIFDRTDKLTQVWGPQAWDWFDLDMWDPLPLDKLYARLVKELQGYHLVMLDPLNKISYGDYTKIQDAQRMVYLLDKLSRELRAHILVNHHVRKNVSDPRYVLRPGDLNNIKGAGELVAGSLTSFMLERETQRDNPHGRGFNPVREGFVVLHTPRAQASPEDISPKTLYFNRQTLAFEDPDRLIFINGVRQGNGVLV